jgi:DNA-nicking Smr family endonuclease
MAGAKRRANIAGERPVREASPRPQLSEADLALFREAMRDVRPLSSEPTAPPRPSRPPRRARARRLDEALSLDLGSSAETESFARPGLQRGVLRKLRRGHYRVEAEIDLHGLTAREASLELQAFLGATLRRGLRCVRVIHGKGLRSERGPVLKPIVVRLLQQVPAVTAFAPAPREAGGSGALHVLLASM